MATRKNRARGAGRAWGWLHRRREAREPTRKGRGCGEPRRGQWGQGMAALEEGSKGANQEG
ncbi:MAG TPA: hypothetical protein VG605_15070, partial [Puia sp.]|nr:hypothetical protein [Puia sp.]